MATSIHVSWVQEQNISDSSFVSHWEQLAASGSSGTDISVYDFVRIMLRASATIRFESKRGGKQNIVIKALQAR